MHTTIRNITAAALTAALALGATPAFAHDAGNEVVVDIEHGVQNQLDSDHDGIPDEWETRGVILKDGTEIPLPDWGADPDTPDVFLQLNWMQETNGKSYAPTPEILDDLVQLFDDNGINLFIDAGEVYTNIPNYTETFGGETVAYAPYYFNGKSVAQTLLKNRADLGERKNIFRLGIIGDQMNPGDFATGNATIGTGAFYVANHSRMTTQEQLRNTILHEFGHNLGLRHNGAADHVEGLPAATHDPAYHSVMNYKYQVGDNAIFDYSHEGYTYTYNGITRDVPADWDNLTLADRIIGQNYGAFGPGQTKPVALEGAKAERKARINARAVAAAPVAPVAAAPVAPVAAAPVAAAPVAPVARVAERVQVSEVKATEVKATEVKAEAVKAQTPAQAAQQIAAGQAAAQAGPNIAAIIGGIIAVLAVLGIGAGAAFMM